MPEALTWLARREGFGVEREYCGQNDSVTIWPARRIRVRPDLDGAQAAWALAHELGHVLLDGAAAHPPGTSTGGCRGTRKVEADSVAFMMSVHSGLDTNGHSFPYGGAIPFLLRSSGVKVAEGSWYAWGRGAGFGRGEPEGRGAAFSRAAGRR